MARVSGQGYASRRDVRKGNPRLRSVVSFLRRVELVVWPYMTCVLCFLQPAVHWGFIPAIIVLGVLTTEPRPTLAQLLSPM